MTDTSALYLISPPAFEPATFAQQLEAALAAGKAENVEIACFQLRLKDVSDEEILEAADRLSPILKSANVPLIMNDRADLAKKTGANGVHLGQSDGSVKEARALLGDDADIGVTCHDSRHLAMIAAEQGADYVAFGAFFPTQTKETEFCPDPEILTAWTMMTTMPCVAIGGINAANAGVLVAAGADYLAVSSAIWSHPDGAAAGVKAFAPVLQGETAQL